MNAARLIQAAAPVAAGPIHNLLGSDRVEISSEAQRQFDSLQRIVARIDTTMFAKSATAAAVDQAIAALTEIEQLAKAARVALGVK